MAKKLNTFQEFQESKQTERQNVICKYLESVQGKGISFPHVTALAEFVAEHIASEEHGECHKATLLRNHRYRSLLENFISVNTPGLDNLDPRKIADTAAQALVTTTMLEVANLRRENERLKAYVASLERAGKVITNAEAVTQSGPLEAVRLSLEEAQIKYALVCQAMHSILESMKDLIAADADAEQFIDLSKMRNNVIVERRLAGPFFEWLHANRGIL
ncbi:hypothetical protein J2777_001265 [Paraburkholderia graminis]|uniref:hypothetical protein n=1 Tax=Paraburkholderia graminis TaxID=60548 RepID=UPI002860A6A2|nr:hypothetical protein [Paraburkholderia graminis]MDR6467572.1 hypothetical protein [Paraburkholderia graminis]